MRSYSCIPSWTPTAVPCGFHITRYAPCLYHRRITAHSAVDRPRVRWLCPLRCYWTVYVCAAAPCVSNQWVMSDMIALHAQLHLIATAPHYPQYVPSYLLAPIGQGILMSLIMVYNYWPIISQIIHTRSGIMNMMVFISLMIAKRVGGVRHDVSVLSIDFSCSSWPCSFLLVGTNWARYLHASCECGQLLTL